MTKILVFWLPCRQYVHKQLSLKNLIRDLFWPFISFGAGICHLFHTSSSVMYCVVLIHSFFFRHSSCMLREHSETDERHLQYRWKVYSYVFIRQLWLRVDQIGWAKTEQSHWLKKVSRLDFVNSAWNIENNFCSQPTLREYIGLFTPTFVWRLFCFLKKLETKHFDLISFSYLWYLWRVFEHATAKQFPLISLLSKYFGGDVSWMSPYWTKFTVLLPQIWLHFSGIVSEWTYADSLDKLAIRN